MSLPHRKRARPVRPGALEACHLGTFLANSTGRNATPRFTMISRRQLVVASGAAATASSAFFNRAFAQDKVVKVGTLKLMHAITPHFYEKFAPAGYKFEIIPFETPTDGKNAVV